jgi:hypothetical protein
MVALQIDTNAIGDRGELIFQLSVTAFHGKQPLFRPRDLGQKWPIADFVIELEGKPGFFFLVQVKTTRKPITPKKRLPVKLAKNLVGLLIASPIPAYLMAVHEPSRETFVVAPRRLKNITNIATTFPLNDPMVRLNLHREVDSFWQGVTRFSTNTSGFAD